MTRLRCRLQSLSLSMSMSMVLIAACASAPPVHFHSLLPADGPPRAVQRQATKIEWQLLPIAIPAQVDRPQLVIRSAADESLVVLEQERWIAPLADEMHAAIAERLTQRFGVAASDSASSRRIRIDVQRFDSAPGRYAQLAADWFLLTDGSAPALACRFEARQPVGAGFIELAAGHRRAVAGLADVIADGLAALVAGRPAQCSRETPAKGQAG